MCHIFTPCIPNEISPDLDQRFSEAAKIAGFRGDKGPWEWRGKSPMGRLKDGSRAYRLLTTLIGRYLSNMFDPIRRSRSTAPGNRGWKCWCKATCWIEFLPALPERTQTIKGICVPGGFTVDVWAGRLVEALIPKARC